MTSEIILTSWPTKWHPSATASVWSLSCLVSFTQLKLNCAISAKAQSMSSVINFACQYTEKDVRYIQSVIVHLHRHVTVVRWWRCVEVQTLRIHTGYIFYLIDYSNPTKSQTQDTVQVGCCKGPPLMAGVLLSPKSSGDGDVEEPDVGANVHERLAGPFKSGIKRHGLWPCQSDEKDVWRHDSTLRASVERRRINSKRSGWPKGNSCTNNICFSSLSRKVLHAAIYLFC